MLSINQNSISMKRVSICWAVVGILMCWSCAVTDVDHTTSFTHFKTFAIGKSHISTKNPVYKSQLIDSNIKANIKAEFVRKGFVYSETKPDLLVSYAAFTENRESYNYYGGGAYFYYPPTYYPYYYPYPFGWYMMPAPYWGGTESSYTSTHGTLILDVRDKRTGKLIWRGSVHGNIDNVKALNKNISKGVKAIMKKYPEAPQPLMPLHKDRIS